MRTFTLLLLLTVSRALCAADAPAATITGAPPARIVVLGDSITAGYGLDPAQAYPALLQAKVDAAGLPYTVVNAGVSGDTTAGGLRRLDWALSRGAAVLIIALGGNDGLRGTPPAETERNLTALIEHARARLPGLPILLAGMEMPPSMGAEFVAQFHALFPRVAQREKVTLIPFLLAGVGGIPALNQADGIHPTPEGQKIVADNVWALLRPALVPAAPAAH